MRRLEEKLKAQEEKLRRYRAKLGGGNDDTSRNGDLEEQTWRSKGTSKQPETQTGRSGAEEKSRESGTNGVEDVGDSS